MIPNDRTSRYLAFYPAQQEICSRYLQYYASQCSEISYNRDSYESDSYRCVVVRNREQAETRYMIEGKHSLRH